MKTIRGALVLAGVALAISLSSASPPAGGAGGAAMERRPLVGGDMAKAWATIESTATPEAAAGSAAAPVMRWHVAVDHLGGEPKYPIGWPRVWRTFKGAEGDWSGWDYLEFRLRAETTREKLPAAPVTLLVKADSGTGSWTRSLAAAKKGEWVPFTIPVADLPQPGAVREIMFSTSDSNYRHKDEVTFLIADLALVRYAAPTLLDLAPEQSVLFADAASVAVQFRASGIKPGDTAPCVCELRQGGAVVARATATVGRGSHRLVLTFGEKPPAPGAYELTARLADGPPTTAAVRLVESPWKTRSAKP